MKKSLKTKYKELPDFLEMGIAFVAWDLALCDEKFIDLVLKGRTFGEYAADRLRGMIPSIRGNGSNDAKLTWADYNAFMEKMCVSCLKCRHPFGFQVPAVLKGSDLNNHDRPKEIETLAP